MPYYCLPADSTEVWEAILSLGRGGGGGESVKITIISVCTESIKHQKENVPNTHDLNAGGGGAKQQ